jgi:flagellar basal-body rod modification protein FlgD
MTTTVSATNSSSSTTSSKTTTKKDPNSPEAIQERFMSLLVAQLKNQDPMQPMDNAQVTSQMAQLNTVSGINNLNSTVEGMAKSFTSNQTLGATSMLGKTILTEGRTVQLANGKATGALDLQQSADAVQVDVLDKSSKVIKTIDLGPLSKGTHQFEWDGTDASGNTLTEGSYKFSITASAAGQDAAVTSMSISQVMGLRNGTDGAALLTSDGSEVALSAVKQVF